MNTMLQNDITGPGGSLKLVQASARSITMDETFERPLAFGYLGFDMLIGPDGILGPPVPTRATLSGEIINSPTESVYQNAALGFCFLRLKELSEAGVKPAEDLLGELNRLSTLVPAKYPCNILGFRDADKPIEIIHKVDSDLNAKSSDFSAVTRYQGILMLSIKNLETAISNPHIQISGFDKRTSRAETFLQEQCDDNRSALKSIQQKLTSHRALLRKAVNLSIFGKEE